jgi:hypothetical protein
MYCQFLVTDRASQPVTDRMPCQSMPAKPVKAVCLTARLEVLILWTSAITVDICLPCLPEVNLNLC